MVLSRTVHWKFLRSSKWFWCSITEKQKNFGTWPIILKCYTLLHVFENILSKRPQSNPHPQIKHFPPNDLFCSICSILPKHRQIIGCISLRWCETECINSWGSICICFVICASSHSCRPLQQITVMGTWPYVSCSMAPCPSATDNGCFELQFST